MHLQARVAFQLFEKGRHSLGNRDPATVGEHDDLPEAHIGEVKLLVGALGGGRRQTLVRSKALATLEPPERDVGVEQQAHSRFQRSANVTSAMFPWMRSLPLNMPRSGGVRGSTSGTTFATGLPRLVRTISPPWRCRSSTSARQ